MTEKIHRSEIVEEHFWTFLCPKCNRQSEIYDKADMMADVECQHCDTVFKIVEG